MHIYIYLPLIFNVKILQFKKFLKQIKTYFIVYRNHKTNSNPISSAQPPHTDQQHMKEIDST